MVYIDDYNSKVINNGPPKKEDRIALAKTKLQMESKQQAVFWYLAGVTIATNYDEVSDLLLKYGYDVTNEEDASSAIANMLGTPKWTKFIQEFAQLMEETIDQNLFDNLKEGSEESGWVEALITAIGQVGGSSLNLASSSKQKKAAETNAKSAMAVGITNVLVEKEKLKAEREKTLREEKKGTVWIVVAVVLTVLAIIGYVIYKRINAQKPA